MYPILEFDPQRKAVINPEDHFKPLANSEYCVITFFREVLNKLNAEGLFKVLHFFKSEMGQIPLYEMEYQSKAVGVSVAGVGGPLAAGFFEEVIAFGYRKFIVCGSAGVLDSEIPRNHVVIPTAALRDEGVSYHYLPPSRVVQGQPKPIRAIESVLQKRGIEYEKGMTWTTDAFYRETPQKVKKRKEEGCITVEMETASYMAVAEFREVDFGQILYGGDDVSGELWDKRDWTTTDRSVREDLFWMALDACLLL